ncbi:Histone-Lysine N-Methyltransferase ash1l [Phytophthora pseudosyringae]|uniref:Histone-Lysine N-Methyltransferase ash1l n=1 Tax=Phytophthora pseudosyringae TaxID=221518 RepID=A0A8T1WFB3_9STRA|nr:Histone-Lysine N-Methyltransferase ash1l [Phytophthora pseudosyringae]
MDGAASAPAGGADQPQEQAGQLPSVTVNVVGGEAVASSATPIVALTRYTATGTDTGSNKPAVGQHGSETAATDAVSSKPAGEQHIESDDVVSSEIKGKSAAATGANSGGNKPAVGQHGSEVAVTDAVKPAGEQHIESDDVDSTELERKSAAATEVLDLVGPSGVNGSVETAETVSVSNKRAHDEAVEGTASHDSHPRKRAAIGSDESAVPSSAGQTTDETVGDSSDDVEMSEPIDEEEVLRNDAFHASEEEKCAHEEFFRNLEEKQQVDVYDVGTKAWLAAKIERLEGEGYTVHYMGWNSKCDEKIDRANSYRIQPRATKATKAWAKHQAKIDKHRRGIEKKLEDAPSVNDNIERDGAEERELVPTFVQTGLTRSGRAITKRVENGALKPKAAAKKKDAGAVESRFPEEDLCGICGEIEDDDLTDMILCDGGCLKSYHFSCLGIDSAPEGEEWLCEQCRTNEQLCFACGRNGTINEKGGVFRCSVASCGKCFHQTCVDANKMSRRAGGKAKGGSSTTEELLESDASFRCPRHICFVCEGKKKSSDLMCCLKCPEAYHPQCVPPSARYNSVGLLCWRHPDDKLPKIPSFYLSDRNIDTVTVDSSLHLPWMFLPKSDPDVSTPDDCHHFRLLKSIIEDVRLQPPTYRKLGRSIYTFKQPKVSLEDAPMCVCKERCGEDCINRLSFTECFGPAPILGMKFNKHNRESNCTLGENCGNRALHQKVYSRFQKFHTVEKGWALRVLEPVKAGQLVIEYVGEVINEEEKERRLLDHAQNSPEDKNMYIMELGKGEYIDARFKGSVSRFINHSCDPNCHLLKWRVKGVNRIAITALKDIEPGTELSYDYQFHTKQAMEWKCHCKSRNCRGTMAPEKINQAHDSPVKKLTKKEQLKQRKRALMHEKIQHDKEVKSTARRLSLTAHVSMGDRTTIDKMVVRAGPATRELQWAKYYRLFHMRDAKHGFNFKLRKEMRDVRVPCQEQVKREQVSVSGSTTAASSRSVSPVRILGDTTEPDRTEGQVVAEISVPKEEPAKEDSVDTEQPVSLGTPVIQA